MEQLNDNIKKKKLFLLDIDGTISFDSTLFDGTLDFMNHVRAVGGKYIFITNNSTKSIADYVDKFLKLGVVVDESNFLTSSYATGLYLKEKYKDQLIFLLGTKSFVEEMKGFGLQVTEQLEDQIAAAVVAFDNELTFDKLVNISQLLQTRAVDYLATNPDLVCPVEFGFIPDCGAICDMIEKATKRQPKYIGKPNGLIVDLALEGTGFTKEETIVIGDRLYTDIACGINGQVDTVAVFTGEVKREDLDHTEFEPTYYCDSIRDIYQRLTN